MSEMGEEVKAMEPQMRAEQAAPQPSVQGAAPAPLPPFLQNVPEPEPEPERMPLTTVHEGLAGESDEEATGLQNRREWSEQPKRQRHQTWMQDRADRKDMARTCSWVPDRAEDEDVWAAHVLQNAVRKSKARKEANNRRGVRDLGLALTNAAKDGKHHPEMWEDMSEMVQSTLKVPAEARTDVKLKLLRGFCRDVGIFGRLDIDRDDAVETQRNLCRRMQYRAFHSHEVIFEQGSHGDTAFVLLAGSVKITVHGRLVRSIKFGECFCMGAVANGDTERPAAALAESGAAVLTLTRSDYLECMDTLLEEAMVCLKKSPEKRRDVDLEMIQAMLASAPFFKRLHYEQPQRLCCRHMRLRLAESGDTVFSFGDEGDQFFYIVDGEVGVVLNDEEVKRLGKTESFGEAALLGSSPLERRRTATIRATQRCVFATMNREEYLRINQEFEDSVAGILVRTPQQRTEEHLRQLTKMFGGIEFFERLEFELAQHSALRYLRYEACPAGHELFHSGEAGDKFYVIVRGEVKIMEVSAQNETHPLAFRVVARRRMTDARGRCARLLQQLGLRYRWYAQTRFREEGLWLTRVAFVAGLDDEEQRTEGGGATAQRRGLWRAGHHRRGQRQPRQDGARHHNPALRAGDARAAGVRLRDGDHEDEAADRPLLASGCGSRRFAGLGVCAHGGAAAVYPLRPVPSVRAADDAVVREGESGDGHGGRRAVRGD